MKLTEDRKAYFDNYRKAHRGEARALSHAHYLRNKEKRYAQQREWAKQHPDKILAYSRKFEATHKESRGTRHEKYYLKEKAARLAARPARLAENRKKRAAMRDANKEAVRLRKNAQARAWRNKNPDRCRAISKLKKVRKINALVGDVAEIRQFYCDTLRAKYIRCYYCNKRVPRKERHIDHKIPLARGGAHAVENLCCACADCNMRKHTRTVEEFTGQLDLFTNGLKKE
jgi:5-methylcytosine-specific restriction endonuclease McrA